MAFTATDVKALRDATGAGMMDCKKALTETDGHFDKAATWLREKGMADAAKRADRTASEGAVTSYIHMGGKIGVLVEVNCETDFVARGSAFQEFCKDMCLQVCSAAPRWVRRDDVPQQAIQAEKQVYMAQAQATGKPEKILERIAEGKLQKWFTQVCLLDQEFVKDLNQTTQRTVEEVMKELSGKVGEKIDVRRFVRFQLGEGIEKKQADLAAEVAEAIAESERT